MLITMCACTLSLTAGSRHYLTPRITSMFLLNQGTMLPAGMSHMAAKPTFPLMKSLPTIVRLAPEQNALTYHPDVGAA